MENASAGTDHLPILEVLTSVVGVSAGSQFHSPNGTTDALNRTDGALL